MDRIGQDISRSVERREPAFFVAAMNDLTPTGAVAHLVSRGRLCHPADVINEAASRLSDMGLPRATGHTGRVFGRHDDERGHAHRTLDLVDLISHNPDR
jgi:hypothetical protein